MKHLLLLLAILVVGCGDGTEINQSFATADGSEASTGDPIDEVNSGCAGSDDQCGQQVR